MGATNDMESPESFELAVEEAKPFLLEKDEEESQFPEPPILPEPKAMSKGGFLGMSPKLCLAILVNCLATAGIVFVNKQIFSNPPLRNCQVAFAAFHFTITATLLYIVSRPRIALFQAKRIDPLDVLPLALSMIFNVVLPNASLAFSSIQFYQVVRVLVTPMTALLNWYLYHITFPLQAAYTLLPVCVGVAVLSWYDTKGRGRGEGHADDAYTRGTSPVGVAFALAGCVASALYGVWIKEFHLRLRCDSSQLLLAQSPVAVGVMLYVIPFSDDLTAFPATGLGAWGLIFLSGLLACLLNISHFMIVNEIGALSSTIVGHFKTCSIVAMGWMVSGKPLRDGSLVGIFLAIGGIML
ncbi:Solute carrier family 35 member E3 [Lecanosticta acicola]|uniref:GDP-mannose transporter n=1 Tax=Lecanosticta acicola TaxID=111012 RepID=A0AAI8Z2T9_9PEZI|nr:Solute carrier family 35 member E3 [Lecanosticta acicola]